MKALVISLAVGGLVGVLYGLLNVRSPAPPYIALLGLLGMLLGEQAVARVRAHMAPPPVETHAASDTPKPSARAQPLAPDA